MGFWNKRKLKKDEAVEVDSKIELIAHKKATQDQINEVKRANDALNTVLAKNGFTIKIYLAMGGSHHK